MRPSPPKPHPDPRPGNRTPLFDRSYLDAQLARAEREHAELETPASWDDEGHFVPPVPPPLPLLEPRRKLAWIGLFGSPLLMLVGVVLGWTYPTWISFGLVVGVRGRASATSSPRCRETGVTGRGTTAPLCNDRLRCTP